MQMRAEVVGLAAATIVAWGTWGVFSKLAVERIDQQVLVWGASSSSQLSSSFISSPAASLSR
jgi:hypothetical protein